MLQLEHIISPHTNIKAIALGISKIFDLELTMNYIEKKSVAIMTSLPVRSIGNSIILHLFQLCNYKAIWRKSYDICENYKYDVFGAFLYARLQTGRIMVWWCPSGSPSVGLSVRPVSVRPFSALFSSMLWHIELKICTWLCFMYYRSSSTVVTLRQFLKELCLFVNLE